jgi:hypothetical protein
MDSLILNGPMISSFFRLFYFSETNQRFPSRVENVIARGSTDQEILKGVNQLIGSNPGDLRRESVGPLSIDTSLLSKNSREINWLDLTNLVQNAQQSIENGASCLFIDCRLIVALDNPTTKITNSGECCGLSLPYLDELLETVYLVSAYDHFKGVPIAPIYLMKESSIRNAIIRFLTGVKISEFNEICICKCDRMMNGT